MIGVLGGTFDPVHFAHLRTALEVAESLALDEVRFVPSKHPPHRGEPGASTAQRLAMLNAAVRDEPRFTVDERELHRGGPSYSVDTLQSLRPELGGVPICFLIGLDAFLGIDTWYRWRELSGLCHFAVMYRPNADHGDWIQQVERMAVGHLVSDPARLRKASAGCVLPLAVTQLDISATAIRQAVRAGRSPRYLLPEPLLEMISSWKLYR